jgi:hypothetical protein
MKILSPQLTADLNNKKAGRMIPPALKYFCAIA